MTKETAPSIDDLASFFLWEIDVKEGKLSASKQILKDTALKNWANLRLGIKDTYGVEYGKDVAQKLSQVVFATAANRPEIPFLWYTATDLTNILRILWTRYPLAPLHERH